MPRKLKFWVRKKRTVAVETVVESLNWEEIEATAKNLGYTKVATDKQFVILSGKILLESPHCIPCFCCCWFLCHSHVVHAHENT